MRWEPCVSASRLLLLLLKANDSDLTFCFSFALSLLRKRLAADGLVGTDAAEAVGNDSMASTSSMSKDLFRAVAEKRVHRLVT